MNRKVSILGAGNVGSLSAMRIAEEFASDVVLIDIASGMAKAKALDLEDARNIRKINYTVAGSDDISLISGSEIVVITAGLTRKPGMQREELIQKNASIVKELCLSIKKFSPDAIVIVVTNPLDLMTRLALKTLGFKSSKVFGMGPTLDASRFANLIAERLNIPVSEVDAVVIGSHGEGMMPLPNFTTIRGLPLEQFMDEQKVAEVMAGTVGRGQEIVSLLGSGSAFFAPSAAVADLVKIIFKDQKRTVGLSACLSGQYQANDICIGVPCRLGREGIEQIIELPLESKQAQAFLNSAAHLKELAEKYL